MKTIIVCLLIILAFSGYMALTTNNKPISSVIPAEPANTPRPEPPTVKLDESMNNLNRIRDDLLKVTRALEEAKKLGNQGTVIYQIEENEEGGEEPEEKYSYADSSIEEEIAEVFGDEKEIALAVAKAESGLNPSAINRNSDGSRDIGIFQINDHHGWSAEERLDRSKNIRMAKELRDRHGWSEWVVYNNKSYQNFL